MSRHLKQMPVVNALPTAYWVSDPTGLKNTSDVDWRNVMLTAEELAVLIPIPDVVLKDSDVDIWGEIRPLVEEAFGKALDEAVLFGINKPSSWPNDIKTAAIAAGNTVTLGTGVDIGADVNNVYASVEADGYYVTDAAFRIGLKAQFRGLRDLNNAFLFQSGMKGLADTSFGSSPTSDEDTLLNVRAIAARNGAFESENAATANSASLIAGDFSQLMLGIREDINVDFSKSAVIHDGNGLVQFNAWQQDMTIGRFVARFAMAVPNPTNRLQETTASRYPFGILRDAA
jgi:HK97 family phage major capsid protein